MLQNFSESEQEQKYLSQKQEWSWSVKNVTALIPVGNKHLDK